MPEREAADAAIGPPAPVAATLGRPVRHDPRVAVAAHRQSPPLGGRERPARNLLARDGADARRGCKAV